MGKAKKTVHQMWSTNYEIEFLRDLIKDKPHSRLTPRQRLENYIQAAKERERWGRVNKYEVLAEAERLLKKC